jgi:hemerythrin superfamily protein
MKTARHDAISMLIADHNKVKALFSQYEGLSDRALATKKKIATEICEELTVHMTLEEEIFYPGVAGPVKDPAMMDEAVVEHASAKELIAQITSMEPGDDLYDAKVKVLSEQIDHHVKEEESEMFPDARKTKVDLVALGEQMAARKEELTGVPA